MTTNEPVKDVQTVHRDWRRLDEAIAGVEIKHLPSLEDDRGELVEIWRPDWGVLDAPVTSVHQVGIRPGKVKGWGMHAENDDRLFVSRGSVRFALFDYRPGSPTYRRLQVFTIGERNRAIVVVPHGVFHALENLGTDEAVVISMPTQLYIYEDPDKYRLPLKNDVIPFDFETGRGW
ncbi:MAG: dTDP-4-dehydrorhamnose 3,5-epimerase family protein [Dehalococcoidia bacterium]